jgi:hypothetical protein
MRKVHVLAVGVVPPERPFPLRELIADAESEARGAEVAG